MHDAKCAIKINKGKIWLRIPNILHNELLKSVKDAASIKGQPSGLIFLIGFGGPRLLRVRVVATGHAHFPTKSGPK